MTVQGQQLLGGSSQFRCRAFGMLNETPQCCDSLEPPDDVFQVPWMWSTRSPVDDWLCSQTQLTMPPK